VVRVTRPVHIEIDPECCVGSSVCVIVAPEVFVLTEDGQSRVHDPGGAALETIIEAAEGCPTMAIRLRDPNSGELIFPKNA
jgi:ferredoxin